MMKIINYFLSMMRGRGGAKPSFKRWVILVAFIVFCVGYFIGAVDAAKFNAMALFIIAGMGWTSVDNLTAKAETITTNTSTSTSTSKTETNTADIVAAAGNTVKEIISKKE